MKASVIILNYNGLYDTIRCVQSLLADDHPDKEIIVWDNGSNRDEASDLQEMFPGIVVVRHDRNLLYAGGNNRAASLATGDILIFLNNDTEVDRRWLEPLLGAFENNPTLGACQPKICSWYQHDQFDFAGGCGGFFDCIGLPYSRGRVISTMERDTGQYDVVSDDLDWVSGACFAVRRQVFIDAGTFDPDLGMYDEEFDLSWRILNRGHSLGCSPASVIYHKGGQTWMGASDVVCFYRHRNNLLTIVKNANASTLVLMLMIRLPLEILAPLFYLYTRNRRCALAPLRSLVSFIKLFPKFFAKRRKFKASSIIPWNRPLLLWRYFMRKQKTFGAMHSII